MKPTKEELIYTLRLLKSISRSTLEMIKSQPELYDQNEVPVIKGKIEAYSDVIELLTDEKEFVRLSRSLSVLTNRYGHDGSTIKEDK